MISYQSYAFCRFELISNKDENQMTRIRETSVSKISGGIKYKDANQLYQCTEFPTTTIIEIQREYHLDLNSQTDDLSNILKKRCYYPSLFEYI